VRTRALDLDGATLAVLRRDADADARRRSIRPVSR
jgi:hypothetical protein